jgi:thiamine biosynthesis lipoprotein
MQRYQHRFTAMGGPCQIQLDHGEETHALAALDAAEAEVRRLDAKFSNYRPDSLATAINASAGSGKAIALDEETQTLLNYADTLCQQSNGMFDMTSGVLRHAWDFKSATPATQADIDQLLPLVGWHLLDLEPGSVKLPKTGMELDFGGLVKEYACDAAAKILREHNCTHALVELAGDISICGPPITSTSWAIGIRHPQHPEQPLAEIALSEGCLASSGDYARGIGHILNPKTGWPVCGLASVSIVADQCLVAGSLATLALLKTEQEALQWLDTLGVPWLAVNTSMQVSGTINGL